MNDAQRNILSAGLICAASAALVGGIYFRGKIDSEQAGVRSNDLLAPGLSASRDSKIEVSEEKQFIELTTLLKRHYVDPIEDEDKLAIGAVKGMISSLDDERSIYMSKPLFRAFVGNLQGQYEGIGAGLALVRPGAPKSKDRFRSTLEFLDRVPRVQVTYIVPGGPADRAGLKAGDEIESIDDRLVVNPTVGERYRQVDADVKSGKAPASARTQMQNDLRQKFQNSMMPLRAFERLTVGREGHVKLAWRRAGKVASAEISKAASATPVNRVGPDKTFRLSFVLGAPEALDAALKADPDLKIDLRGSSQGDYKVMLACLSRLVPAGDYGQIVKARGAPQIVKVLEGVAVARPHRLLVDGYTRGLAEAFALALRSRGAVAGEALPMGGDPAIVERTSLPDGSGFTLRVGDYHPPRRSA